MAKKRKTPVRFAKPGRSGSDLSFIEKAIDEAIASIERRGRELPSAAERRVLKGAVGGLKCTKLLTKLHCGPMWYMAGK
jgi:hypothetical protein